jgi:hypothetical protein
VHELLEVELARELHRVTDSVPARARPRKPRTSRTDKQGVA